MIDNTIIARLKTNLGYAGRLPCPVQQNIEAAAEAALLKLAGMGIELDLTRADDEDLLIAYAMYRYSHKDSDRGMSPSLRRDINDRKVEGKRVPPNV